MKLFCYYFRFMVISVGALLQKLTKYHKPSFRLHFAISGKSSFHLLKITFIVGPTNNLLTIGTRRLLCTWVRNFLMSWFKSKAERPNTI